MIYKYDFYGIGFVGGKIVVWVVEFDVVKDELISVIVELLELFDGVMIIGCDFNISLEDMECLMVFIFYVLVVVGSFVDVSVVIVYGIFGVVEVVLDKDFNDVCFGWVFVYGCGVVGGIVVCYFVEYGWIVFIVDLDCEKVSFFGVMLLFKSCVWWELNFDLLLFCLILGLINVEMVMVLKILVVVFVVNVFF